MKKRILIDANFPTETRVAVLDKNNNVEAFEYDNEIKRQIKNNIYLAKITRVEPSLQAAFVDYGDEKSGFLPFSEIHPDYFNIPVNDRKAHLKSLSQITPPDITGEEDNTPSAELKSSKILDSEEVDVDEIQKLVENKVQPDFDIDAEDSDIGVDNAENNEEAENYKIQEVIKKGQILLVQATKEERGNKGASLTTYISLAGKYCVLMPNKPSQNGISRKIANVGERRRLRDIINNLTADRDNASIIVRTAGAGHSNLDIKRDYEYLSKLWNKIREATLQSTAPSFIHQEDGLILKAVRDLFDKNVKEVLVQGPEAYSNCLRFVSDMMPNERSIVKEYKSKTPIFTKFRVEEQLTKLYQTNVQLPSGGYIVINPTEALISIDVNSGRSTQERNIEDMALKTNVEAAREIARQARLRDLSGLLVLDFIDMSSNKHRRIVERTLREFMSKDKARIQMAPISTFGLLELSRQRLRPSFLEVNSIMCNHCSGKGIIRADEANSMLILRTIENEIFNSSYDVVNVHGVASSIIYLLNNKRAEIDFVEQKYDIKLNFYIDKDATSDSYSIEKVRLNNKKKKNAKALPQPILQDTSNIYSESEPSTKSRKKIETKEARKQNSAAKPSKEDDTTNVKPRDEQKRKRPARKHKKHETSESSDLDDNLNKNKPEDIVDNKTASDTGTIAERDNSKTDDSKDSQEQNNKPVKANRRKKQATTRKPKESLSPSSNEKDQPLEAIEKSPEVKEDNTTPPPKAPVETASVDNNADNDRSSNVDTILDANLEPQARNQAQETPTENKKSTRSTSSKKRIAKKAASKNAKKPVISKQQEEDSQVTKEA